MLNIDREWLENELKYKFIKDIAKEIGTSRKTLSKIIKNYNIIYNYNKNINHDYFKNWSSDMAYILGFFTADACIRNNLKSIKIEIQKQDIHILEYIKEKLQSNANIRNTTHFSKKYNKYYYACEIELYSKFIIKDLYTLGVIPRKTGQEKLPNIPDKYKKDYIRGFFDGDGSAMLTQHGKPRIVFCCKSLQFIEDLKKMIGLDVKIQKRKSPSEIYVINYKLKDTLKLRDIMYYEECFSLKRKKDILYTKYKPSHNKISIRQIDIKTNKEIKIWDCARDAGLALKGDRKYGLNINRACNSKNKIGYGYKWEYIY